MELQAERSLTTWQPQRQRKRSAAQGTRQGGGTQPSPPNAAIACDHNRERSMPAQGQLLGTTVVVVGSNEGADGEGTSCEWTRGASWSADWLVG